MHGQMTLEELEQQVIQLPWHEQLKLISHISEQLSIAPLDISKETLAKSALREQREKEANEILALCDSAAEMWEGKFDSAEDIRQMREERDEQIWQNTL
jgi:hypothetical protein